MKRQTIKALYKEETGCRATRKEYDGVRYNTEYVKWLEELLELYMTKPF